MKLSTKSRYGVRAMLFLTLTSRENPIPVREISEREGIPVQYLEQILLRLKKAGLVKSTAGAFGGWRLARPPSRITVLDIMKAVKEPLIFSPCLVEDSSDVCSREVHCRVRSIWKKSHDVLEKNLKSITLDSLGD